ncbi:MAG: type II secretion system protein GspG [Planctomycetaceae bacterium]
MPRGTPQSSDVVSFPVPIRDIRDIRLRQGYGGQVRGRNFPVPGFTLVELLAVLTILTLLVAMAVGVGTYVMDKAKKTNTENVQKMVLSAIDAYQSVAGAYPASSADTASLVTALKGQRLSKEKFDRIPAEYLDSTGAKILDGYGKEMRYESNGGFGNAPVLISGGKDGIIDAPSDTDNIRSDGR